MFSPNTRVYAPDGYVRIRKLKINDEIIVLEGIRMLVGRVHLRQKIQVHRDYIVKLQFEGCDKKITCSEEQIFYDIQEQPVSAGEIEIGENCKGLHHNHHTLIGREKIEHDSQLDRLEKAGHHEFFLYNLLLVGHKNLEADKFYLNSGILTKGDVSSLFSFCRYEGNKYKNYMENKA